MPEILLPNRWDPRPYQMKAWEYMMDGGRYAVLAWHRRAGKDDFSLSWTSVSAMRDTGMYWHCLPEYGQGRKAIWDAVDAHSRTRRIDRAFPREILANDPRDKDMFIRFKGGSSWQVAGSDSYNKLVGAGTRGLVFSEFALADPSAWDYMQPMIEESGGWAMFISTVRGRNHFYQLGEYAKKDPDWFYQCLTVDETGVFTQSQLDKILAQLKTRWGDDMGEAVFRQEYYNDPDVTGFKAFITGQLVAKCREYRAVLSYGEPIVWGLDVARDGLDKSALAIREGRKVHEVFGFREPNTMMLCEKIAARFQNDPRRPDAIFVDGVGMGAGVVDRLRQLLGPQLVMDVQAAGKALDPAKYANKRAEMWGRMRDAFVEGTELPNEPQLVDELTWPLCCYEKISERLALESKDDIRERHGGSPDVADALALTYAAPVVRRTTPVEAMRGVMPQPRNTALAEYNYFG